jgi:hypothetical protein
LFFGSSSILTSSSSSNSQSSSSSKNSYSSAFTSPPQSPHFSTEQCKSNELKRLNMVTPEMYSIQRIWDLDLLRDASARYCGAY